MPADNSGVEVGYLAGRYPGRVGHLYCDRTKGPWPFVPYALDNGAYGAWKNGRAWDGGRFRLALEYYRHRRPRPRWVAVPDVVADRPGTLARWGEWAPRLRGEYGWPLAFVVQDGMAAADVPADADVVFVGGTTEWKWRTMERWAADFPRAHVGKVNHYWGLWRCHDAGVESCDGTGWVRGDQRQLRRLYQYFAEASGERPRDVGCLFASSPASNPSGVRSDDPDFVGLPAKN